MDKLLNLSINEIHSGLIGKKFSANELARVFIAHIKKTDDDIKAFLSYDFDGALAQAKKVDEKIALGEEISQLAGVPCAVKDNILVKGLKATAAAEPPDDPPGTRVVSTGFLVF